MLKILAVLFVTFVVYKTSLRLKKGDIHIREFIIWLIFWLLVLAAILVPQQTDVLAQLVGVERGADLLFFVSIVVLFYAVFKIIVKLEKVERNITEIVRNTAIKNSSGKDEQ